MKKNIYLLITFMVSLFIFCGRVDAAKELVCIYDGGPKMIVQYSDGRIELYTAGQGKAELDNPHWKINDSFELNFEPSSFYDTSSKTLSDCPKYSSGVPWRSSGTINFGDEIQRKYNGKVVNITKELVDGDASISSLQSGIYKEFSSSDEIPQVEWLGICEYGFSEDNKLILYFNDELYFIDNNLTPTPVTSRAKFTLDELLEYVKKNGYCPYTFYEYYGVSTNNFLSDNPFVAEYSLKKPSGLTGIIGGNEFVKRKLPILKNEFTGSDDKKDDEIEINDCTDLFGDELISLINKIMNWIKIIVPILLIAYGTIDFTRAVFSGREDDMKKLRGTFIKRIVAALLVFIAPIFVNLLLSIANEVWSFINPNTCINVENNE